MGEYMSKEKKNYWTKEQENAIIYYQTTKDADYYSKELIPHFRELIKNIYLTYNFNKILIDYKNVEQEMLTFIFEKIDKFDPSRGTKAFSYFGTVIKNYLIQKCSKEKKNIHIDEENKLTILNGVSIKKYQDATSNDSTEDLLDNIHTNIMKYSDRVELTEEDIAIINIINDILSNYKKVDIYNKKQLYVYIREYCDYPTRKITLAINKMKIMYGFLKEDYLN